jgi:hypothetical protein
LVQDHQLFGQLLGGWTLLGDFSLRANAIERGLHKGDFGGMKNPGPGSMMTDHNTLRVLCEFLSRRQHFAIEQLYRFETLMQQISVLRCVTGGPRSRDAIAPTARDLKAHRV